MLKRLFPHTGNKTFLLPKILEMTPKNIRNYYELFGGSGIVLFNIKAEKYFYNELDFEVYDKIKWCLTNDIDKTQQKALATYEDFYFYEPTNIHKYIDYINKNGWDGFDIWLLGMFAYMGDVRINYKKQTLNITPRDEPPKIRKINAQLANLRDAQIKVKGKIELLQLDAFYLLKTLKFNKGDLIYLDPPYSGTFADYNKGWSVNDDEKLAQLLRELTKKGVNWMLSGVFTGTKGFKNEIWRKLGEENTYQEIDIHYNMAHKKSTEFIMVNYKWEPNQLSLFGNWKGDQ